MYSIKIDEFESTDFASVMIDDVGCSVPGVTVANLVHG